jgi:L-iditol 2-dehydrogenase
VFMKNEAFFMTGLNQMEMREVPMPEAKAGEAVVQIEYVGICGSDVHYYQAGRIGNFKVQGDFILGHECAGRVVALGAGVENLKIGDRVALEPGITCGQCRFCKSGRYNLCPDVEFLATPPYHGALVRYLAFPANMCFVLPESVTSQAGVLIEPLAVGIHAANQGRVQMGDSVVILGAGCIGLCTMLACMARGASDIIVTDVLDNRLAFAKKKGARAVINARNQDVLATVAELTGGRGADVVIETAGSAATIAQTAHLVGGGGRIVLVGLAAQDEISYNFAQIMAKEAEIASVFRYRNIYPAAIDALAGGKIVAEDMVTKVFGFDESKEAFDYVIGNKDEVIKVLIGVS